MKVAVVDCSVSGHRETYYRVFARTFADLGHRVLLVAPRLSGVEGVADFRRIQSRPLLPLPVGRPLRKKLTVVRNAWIRLANLASLRRQLQDFRPDLVYFPCLDDILPTLGASVLLNRLFPYRWSGLLVQSALPPYKFYLPDVRPALRGKRCLSVGVLNEYSVESLKAFQPRLYVLPDFADLSAPDTAYTLYIEIKRRAVGRKVVSLLGSIGERKGIRLLMQSIPLLPEEEYFFVVAGRPWLSEPQLGELRALESSRTNCLFALEQIPDEACFNALVEASDVLFAAYRNFTGSSNLLTKAAAFARPILVSRGQCMGRRVERYGIGLAIDETDATACAEALAHLCREGAPDPAGFARYAEAHSLGRLREIFIDEENKN